MARSQHTNILTALAAASFIATAEQVRELAGGVQFGQESGDTYFKVVLAHTMAKLAKRGRRSEKAQLEAVDNVHAILYPEVLAGVGPDGMESVERTRRARFASSASSTIRYFIRKGGDVRSVDLATATKTSLRTSAQPASKVTGATRIERAFNRARDSLFKNSERLLARGDPEAAQEQIEQLMADLEKLLANPPAREERKARQPAARITGQRLTRTPASENRINH